MSEQELPDWLKALRPKEFGGPTVEESVAEAGPPAEAEPVEAAPPSPPGEFDLLREKAATRPMELEAEEPVQGSPLLQVIRSLKPWQRFTLALLVFMNVSTLGCFILLVLGRIAFVR